jgi:centromere-localized protein 2
MAPTEEKILEQYLVTPSQLPAIISLEKFKEYFPQSMRSSPRIRTLYRDLHSQRNAQLDGVQANIDTEAKRGKALRRAVAKARLEAEHEDVDLEIELEKAVGLSCLQT